MAFTWAANRNITNAGAATSLANNLPSTPAVGSIICASFFWFDGSGGDAGTFALKDSNNNFFTLPPSGPANQRPTTSGIIYTAYLIAPSNITNAFTASWTNACVVADLEIEEFSVSGGTAVFDIDAIGTGSSGTTINTPTIGAASGSLIHTSGSADHQVSSVDSPFTQVLAGITNPFSEGVGYLLSGSGSTQNAMTMNVSSGWISAMMAFKLSGGAPADALEWMQKSQANQLLQNYSPIIIPTY